MRVQRVLHLDGRDVLAAADDDVLGAVFDLDVTVRMTDGQVYTLIFHHGAEDEQGAGERITFTRNGDSVVLDSELTKPIERFTRALWPDG